MEAQELKRAVAALRSALDSQQRLLQSQQERIAALEAGGGAAGSARAEGDRRGMSRAGMIKAAALGLVGVAGAEVLLGQSTGVALAQTTEGQTTFTSNTSTPTVTISNTGTGGALSGTANTSIAAIVTNTSTAGSISAIEGVISSATPGAGSAGVRGINNGAATSVAGVSGIASSGYAVAGSATTGFGVLGTASTGHGVVGDSTTNIGVYGGSYQATGFAGETLSTAGGVGGVQGLLASTSPAANSAGVRGISNSTTANSYGVFGTQAGSGIGVYGYTPQGTGVYGEGDGDLSLGVWGNASGNDSTGVYGFSAGGDGYGVWGSGPGVGAYGVVGQSTSGTGVWGGSDTGAGVYGTSGSTSAEAAAVLGLIESYSPGSFSAGVVGQTNDTGSQGAGVFGAHNAAGYGVVGASYSGWGVYAQSTSGTGAEGYSASGTGVLGFSQSATGIVGQTNGVSSVGVEGIVEITSPGNQSTGVYGLNNGTGAVGAGVWGQHDGSGYGVYGSVSVAAGTAIYGAAASTTSDFGVYSAGNFGASGTKAAIVPFADGRHRAFYCLESPECWFEDFGSATTRNGRATVKLDPKFAASVNTEDYHVFLTPRGNSRGLFVSRQTARDFQVREAENGRSDVLFSYRIVALRGDVDAPRLRIVTPPAVLPRREPAGGNTRPGRPAIDRPLPRAAARTRRPHPARPPGARHVPSPEELILRPELDAIARDIREFNDKS